MNFNISRLYFCCAVVFTIISCSSSNDFDIEGSWYSQKDKRLILILDSILIDSHNVFCAQQIVRGKLDSLYLRNECHNSEGNGIYLNSTIKRKRDSVFIFGLDTFLFERVKNLKQKEKIKSVSIHIFNKPFGFPYSSIKIESNGVIFLDGMRKGVLLEKMSLLNIVDFKGINHEYEDDEFAPGYPMINMKVHLQEGVEKEVKLLGWNKAPHELQIFLMYIMSSSLKYSL